MNDVITKRRPMIDLDEFERRLGRPCSTDQRDGDPLAERLRINSENDDPHKTDFEPNTQLSATAPQDAGEPGESQQPDAHVPLVGGDFAAIEAGLLGTKQPVSARLRDAERSTVENKRPEPVPLLSGDFAAIEAGLLGTLPDKPQRRFQKPTCQMPFQAWTSDRNVAFISMTSQLPTTPASQRADEIAAPTYVIVAIVFVGMTGVAVSFGLNSRLSAPSDIASITADNGPTKPQTDDVSNADVPIQDVANPRKPAKSSPMPLDNGTKRTFDVPQAKEKALPPDPRPTR